MSGDSALDEMADGSGNAKPHWRSLLSTMFALGHETLSQRARLLDQAFAEEGITAILPGERAVTGAATRSRCCCRRVNSPPWKPVLRNAPALWS
jgi:uncharacterized circularly permuted ATP-grasp superfamily protein